MENKNTSYLRLHEKEYVEEPFLKQLEELGWNIVRLDTKQTPQDSNRESFSEVILTLKLRDSLFQINPWLEEDQIDEVVKTITTFPISSLIENNQYILELLLENTSVSENRKTKEKHPTVRYIDFKNAENNSFVAISQLKLRVLGTENHIYPDITLFINGLPIAVIECKSPKTKEPIPEAIDQLLRYSTQRGEDKEGNKNLFYYNQILIATCRNQAKFGTITTHIEKHFFRWIDPYPKTVQELEHEGTAPNDQQRLIQGMLCKENLLSLIKTFTLFSVDPEGKTIKIVARYQQFRAVKLAVKRLREGRNKLERGGIIWHTQGSGKSLTMMFLVREMYHDPKLKEWKVVFVTDRTQLEQQLTETSGGIGYPVKPANSIFELKRILPSNSSYLVMAMIHKFQERELQQIFPELNPSPNILVLIDEAHRSEYGLLGANLEQALPNATRIAFTGTPIPQTERTFGDYIDKYTMRQSIEDGTTLEIVYEGRTHGAEVKDSVGMDVAFKDVFKDYNPVEWMQILGYGSREAYLEAESTINSKAEDMVRHYVRHIFPNGFKAQIVTCSKEAAVRYKKWTDEALKKIITELEQNNPYLVNIELLKTIKSAVVISSTHNDLPHIREHTDSDDHVKHIAGFKLSYDSKSDDIVGDVGFLIVHNMLITGFDAPIEQVMYLDRVIKDHNLLQAIARVNRVGNEFKDKGFVIDYVGIGHHLKDALAYYEEKEQIDEIIEALSSPEEELSNLVEAHKKLKELIEKSGLKDLSDYDAFYDLFYDEDVRFEFMLKFREFSKAFGLVFPSKEVLKYLQDFLAFTEINVMASKHFRDSRLSMKGIPAKLRKLTDEYLVSKGIDLKVAPISIVDENFHNLIESRKRAKTKASEIEHALRHHIEINLEEDPELYSSLSEKIKEILEEFKNNWDEIYRRLEGLRKEMLNASKEPTYGLHRKKQFPIFRKLKSELFEDKELSETDLSVLVNLTQNLYNSVEREIRLTGFWNNIPAQNRLKAELQEILLSPEHYTLPNMRTKWRELISRIMEFAEKNNDTILYAS
jgi:type I restriction enzyme R subunit